MKKLISSLAICSLLATGSVQAAMFGEQLFGGNFKAEQFSGFNPNYTISLGDKIQVKFWGAYTFAGTVVVDPQGNIFLPSIGPVPVAGIKNGELQSAVENSARKIFTGNVHVYASLETAQPVKVFVTGFVNKPGLYGGLSSDSVLYYLDKASGVDSATGSYLNIKVLRNNQVHKEINLYDFLVKGSMDLVQLVDGDTIVVGTREKVATVRGDVLNANTFEFKGDRMLVADLLSMSKPKPTSTHVSISRKQGSESTSEYLPLADAGKVWVQDGDEVVVTSDKFPGTIMVRVEGAHSGDHTVVVPTGSTMKEVLSSVAPNSMTNFAGIQLYRETTAKRQKEMLHTSLAKLEAMAYTARSATQEESQLRAKEAELVSKFVDKAKSIVPVGQVIIESPEAAQNILLENNDVIRIPGKTSLVLVHGEVLFPNAIAHKEAGTIADYIRMVGGYTQKADTSKVLIMHPNGVVEPVDNLGAPLAKGDEVFVLPAVDSKNIEVTRGISQILYQIAVAAKIVFGL